MEESTLHKMRINRFLEPVKVMLVNRKNTLRTEDWLSFVERTKASILDQPHQYLDSELPPRELLVSIINSIFEDFVERVHPGIHNSSL